MTPNQVSLLRRKAPDLRGYLDDDLIEKLVRCEGTGLTGMESYDLVSSILTFLQWKDVCNLKEEEKQSLADYLNRVKYLIEKL